jgi:hypothetical protein
VGSVGERFDVRWWGGSGTLTLAGVSDLSAPDLAGRDDAFSLAFAPDGSVVPGNLALLLGNDRLGTFQLLLTPIGPAGPQQQLEAVINRSVGVDRRAAPKPPARTPPVTPPVTPPGAEETAMRFVRRARARRTAHGVRFDVVFKDGARARRAHAWLLRKDRVVAAFDWVPVREHHAVLRVRNRQLRPGRYVLVVGTGRQDGALARVPIRLR